MERKTFTLFVIPLFVLALLSPHPAKAAPAAQAAPVAAGGQTTQEIEALRKELQEKPGEAAFIRLGNLLLETGDANGALQAFEDALRLNPRSFEARTGKGVVLGRQGKFAEAGDVLAGALALNPHPARVHYELGILYEKQGEFGKAIAEYKEGLNKKQEEKGGSY